MRLTLSSPAFLLRCLSGTLPVSGRWRTMRSVTTWTALVCMIAFTTNAALIAHYDFGDGDLLDDESGNTNTLTGPLGTSASVTLNHDDMGSAHFDPTGDQSSYLQADLDYPVETSFTVSFWWKAETVSQHEYDSLMSGLVTGTAGDWQIDNGASAILRLNGRNGTLSVQHSTLSAATWYHMALVSDIAAGSTNASLYLTRQGMADVELDAAKPAVSTLVPRDVSQTVLCLQLLPDPDRDEPEQPDLAPFV